MKAFISILIVIIILGLLAAVARSVKTPAPVTGTVGGLQICPTEKINNRMPGPGGPKPSYYILNGERKEIDEFDAVWVAANCTVPEQAAY